MIRSFGSKETEKIWNGVKSTKLPVEIQNVTRGKLRMINNSIIINDLRISPSSRLEKLKRNLDGIYSIRINDQWRIIFNFKSGNAFEVKVTGYH